MSLRWPVAVTALIVSLLLLFGGYTLFQWTNLERPLKQTIAETPTVTAKEITVSPDKITIRLEADAHFSLTQQYPSLQKQLTAIAGGRPLEIEMLDHPDKTLNQAWGEMVFGVEEGLAHQRYSAIPAAVKKATPSGAESYVVMDDSHLYIEIKQGEARLYRILPLHKKESGVKDNG
ncbi:hypothetical protein [Desmospora activa]|uniref:Uncharacterized protein n=1 Tax=Desmospora activa DSM 45169 TaxID=1121389 RepID=A0A2T4ZA46_9BACL|nr:hypothetical protein [Desmospora activa]PTM58771.1 hypothetical protein C8J48_1361 [Desmospora activa DSM 45169]